MADSQPPNFVGKWASTLSGARMLMYDSGATDVKRFVVFASDEQLKLLEESTEIAIDATFESAPEEFDLVWTIHCRSNDKFYLAVVVFLSGCRAGILATTDYSRVIMSLRQDPRLQNWIVERIYSDYEVAPGAAFRRQFPRLTFTLCLFHKNQNLRKKAASLHLLNRLIGPLLKCYKRFLVLPFLPAHLIPDAFDELKAEAPFSAAGLLDYHESIYIRGRGAARFPPDKWSIHDALMRGDPRCNNSKESFHLQFGAIARADLSNGRRVRPSRAVYAIQLEEEKVRQDLAAPHNVSIVRGARQTAEAQKNEKLRRLLMSPFTRLTTLLDQLSTVMRP